MAGGKKAYGEAGQPHAPSSCGIPTFMLTPYIVHGFAPACACVHVALTRDGVANGRKVVLPPKVAGADHAHDVVEPPVGLQAAALPTQARHFMGLQAERVCVVCVCARAWDDDAPASQITSHTRRVVCVCV